MIDIKANSAARISDSSFIYDVLRVEQALSCGLFVRLFCHRNLGCHPDVVVFAFVGELIVLFEIFAGFEVVGNFPANFTHWLGAFRAVHDSILSNALTSSVLYCK